MVHSTVIATVGLADPMDEENIANIRRTMMGLLYHKAVSLPEEKKTADTRAMIETYNKQVDFVDFDRLNEIMEQM